MFRVAARIKAPPRIDRIVIADSAAGNPSRRPCYAFRAGELGQGSDGLGAYVMRVRRA